MLNNHIALEPNHLLCFVNIKETHRISGQAIIIINIPMTSHYQIGVCLRIGTNATIWDTGDVPG
jgi:hypothetical protein